MIKKDYPKPTIEQCIASWHLVLDLIELGYPHNWQHERSDIVAYMREASKIVKQAHDIKEYAPPKEVLPNDDV